jgi:flagellin
MVALQTLKTINKNLSATQNQISTGKQIANAKDNAAIWAITTVMSTDVSGFKAIGESLSLGDATLSVARDGAETVADLLDQLKGKVVAAQEQNVDRTKIQADVDALRNQIITVVDAAQFNGLNLLKGDAAQQTISVLASLNRTTTGVTASQITFARAPLDAARGTLPGALTQAAGAALAASTAVTVTAGATYTVGDVVGLKFTTSAGEGVTVTTAITTADLALTADALATALAGRLDTALGASGLAGGGTIAVTGAAGGLIQVADATTTLTYSRTVQGFQGGGLAALTPINVTTKEGAASALNAMEQMIQAAITAASAFGSAQGRIATQGEYVSKIMDGLSSGVGALVDADMEEASARLQALQVQQQLGVQALSIANQSPQNILALFQR